MLAWKGRDFAETVLLIMMEVTGKDRTSVPGLTKAEDIQINLTKYVEKKKKSMTGPG